MKKNVMFFMLYREKRSDPEPGKLHLQVPGWNGGHHPTGWPEAPTGAFYEAPNRPVSPHCQWMNDTSEIRSLDTSLETTAQLLEPRYMI